jgi:hypothetical protein
MALYEQFGLLNRKAKEPSLKFWEKAVIDGAMVW